MPPFHSLRRTRQKRLSSCQFLPRWQRSTKTVFVFVAFIIIYLLILGTSLFRLNKIDNPTPTFCLQSESKRINISERHHHLGDAKPLKDGLFRILCTSTRRKIEWGSYQLRCRDLKAWAHKCTDNVRLSTNIPFEDIQRPRWIRYMFGQLVEEKNVNYNATIFVKSFPKKILPLYGNIYVDLVDEYNYVDEDIPADMHLIVQTRRQGNHVFSSHNFTVVEHWYNSYPADMMSTSGRSEYIPTVSNQTTINIATIWNTKRENEPTEGGCPKLNSTEVTYNCLDQAFDITTWYLKLFKREEDKCEMERTIANPQLGAGMLYYNVFRKFDALVVLAKNDSMKLDYGNVQRAVSQMRSGVPILLEIRGKVLENFVERYNYTCIFQRYHDYASIRKSALNEISYWSFTEAVEQLKRPEIRKKCQEQGLMIVNDYSPSRIAQKFLKTVGYKGEFNC